MTRSNAHTLAFLTIAVCGCGTSPVSPSPETAAGSAPAPDAIRTVRIGPPGFPGGPTDINVHGTVIGTHPTAQGLGAFRWSVEEGIVFLPSLSTAAGRTIPHGINDDGVIVGGSPASDGTLRPVMWVDNQIAELPAPPGNSLARAINNRGDVLITSSGAPYVWTPESGLLPLAESSASDISDTRYVVGPRPSAAGYLWHPRRGVTEILPGSFGRGHVVNDQGHVAFNMSAAAWIWTIEDGARLLPTLPWAGFTEVFGMNDRGDAVGDVELGAAVVFWPAEGGLIELDGTHAAAVNNRRQIVGHAPDGTPVMWTVR